GWALAEGQINAAREKNDDRLLHFWRQERSIVLRADKFSTVSDPQEKALIGELALLGRLNRYTAAYTFAHAVPNAVNPYFLNPPAAPAGESLRGRIVPAEAFVVLWSGGFNSWTDVAALHEGLCSAMSENPSLHFVSTGGEIFGYDDKTYADFQSRVAAGPHRDRFHLLGWVAMELLPLYYRQADLGLSMDGVNYETIFGARNRINNMMALGLAVATSRGTEISRVLEKEKLGLTFEPANAVALAQALAGAFGARGTLKSLGERGRQFVLEHWSPHRTTKPLQAWAERPSLAPDNAERRRRAPDQPDLLRISLHPAEEIERLIEQVGDGPLRRALAAEQGRAGGLWRRIWGKLQRRDQDKT
ncbi:MAG: glycosyltransferase, partial [bacterium]